MFTKSRRRLVGILVAVATPVFIGALALPANGLSLSDPILSGTCGNVPNLVADCGFEAAPNSGPIPGWTHLVNHFSGWTSSTVHSGGKALYLASTTGNDDVWTQTIKVTPHTKYLVGVWFDALGGGTNNFSIDATNISGSSDGSVIYGIANATAGWQHQGAVITTTGASTITLILRGSNGPSDTYVDDVTMVPFPAGCSVIANNKVADCGFESGAGPWVHSGTQHNSQVSSFTAFGGTESLRFASTSGDDTWYQVLSLRPKTQYTLSFWVEVYTTTATTTVDHLNVSVSNVPASGGTLNFPTLSNIKNRYWTHYVKTFTTGTGSGAVLTFKGLNVPESTYVDDVSVTAVPHVKITHSGRVVTTTLNGVGGQKVYLEKKVGTVWKIVHTWTAPTTGYTKSWALTVGSAGSYRAVAASAPGYSSAVSAVIAVS